MTDHVNKVDYACKRWVYDFGSDRFRLREVKTLKIFEPHLATCLELFRSFDLDRNQACVITGIQYVDMQQFFTAQSEHIDLDVVGQLQQGFGIWSDHRIVQRNPVAAHLQLAAALHDPIAWMYAVQQFEYGALGR